MTSSMPRHFLLAMSNATDPERADELDRWYEEIHVPDVLETPGIVRATRYRLGSRVREGQAQFLAAYELESDDFRGISGAMRETIARKSAEGRSTDLIDSFSVGYYTQTSEHEAAAGS